MPRRSRSAIQRPIPNSVRPLKPPALPLPHPRAIRPLDTPFSPLPPHANLLSSGFVEHCPHLLILMHKQHIPYSVAFSRKSWTGAFVRSIAPRRHLRVLPTLTRPSLFGSD